MSGDIMDPNGGLVIHQGTTLENPFKAFEPAKPTLAVLEKIGPARRWLADERRRDPNDSDLLLDLARYPAFELADIAKERLALIPVQSLLDEAKRLFHDAEHVPAPTAWYALAFAAMLSGAPNAKSVVASYTYGLLDSLLYDEDLREHRYRAGFSCAVVVLAIRQLRREQTFIPAPAEVLQACLKHRRRFRDLDRTIDILTMVRTNAEEVLAEDKRQYEQDWGPEEEGDWAVPKRPPGWQPPVDDGEELPF